MTPERLANYIPQLLEPLRPPTIPSQPGNPVAICHWLNQLTQLTKLSTAPAAPAVLGKYWPTPPKIAANDFALAQAPQVPLLPSLDSGPIRSSNQPGINPLQQQIPALESCKRIAEHVIACSGEVAFSRTDFIIPGPLPFLWQRFYRHSNPEDVGLGKGWRHSLSETIQVLDSTVELHTAEGRTVSFNLPAIGHSCFNRQERLLLQRQSLHSYRVSGFDEHHRIFRADGINHAFPLVELRDDFGNSISIDYQQGLPGKLVSSWGRVVEFKCSEGRIDSATNLHEQHHQKSLCEYLHQDGQLSQIKSGGNTESYRYIEALLSEIESDKSGLMHFDFDNQKRCNQLIHNHLKYTLSWRKTQRTCTLNVPDRHSTHWKFNSSGQLVSEKQDQFQKKFFLDHYGNFCQCTEADGSSTIYRYDELGRITRKTSNNTSDRYSYSSRGLVHNILVADDQNWDFQYKDSGLPEVITDPAGQNWRFHYSDRGHLIQFIDPENGQADFTWDSQGQLISVQRGDQIWQIQYDHWHRPISLILNDETIRQWVYATTSELSEIFIGKHHYQLDYDAAGRCCALHLKSPQSSDLQSLHWNYDDAGNCQQLRFADGRQWRMQFNDFAQISELDCDSHITRWRYNQFGQLHACENTSNQHWQWSYYSNGNISEYRDNDSRWYFRYTQTGALDQVRNNSGQQCEFHYDNLQRLVQANTAHSAVRFRYNSLNLLIAEHHDSKDAASLSIHHQYDTRGWLKRSSTDNLDSSFLIAPSGTLFGVDLNGEAVIRCQRQDQASEWVQGQLQTYRQHQAGELTQLESNRDLHWQFTTIPPVNLCCPLSTMEILSTGIKRDARGHIARELRPGKRAQQTREYVYQYDGWGLLSSAECGDFKTYYRYDPFGRRLSKLTTHRKSTRQRRVHFQWTSFGLWSETQLLNGKLLPVVNYLHHPLQHSLLCRVQDGLLEHYLVDGQGKPLARFDHQGQLQWQVRYSAEGDWLSVVSGSNSQDHWRGKGQLSDSETGLYYGIEGYWHPLLGTRMNAEHSIN